MLALNMNGKKKVPGLYLSESEGANFWLPVLTDLRNRGVEDILIASVDGVTGFPEAIASIFPNTEVPVVHCASNPQLVACRGREKSQGIHGPCRSRTGI